MASANNSKQTVAVIGAGMTGITCARALYVAGYDVTVFEKSRGLGGRMATRRVGKTLTIDHGAQFITARSDAFKSFMQRACKAGTAEIWQPRLGEDEEAVLEALMMQDVDVTDIELEDGVITVFAPHTEFFKAKTALNEEYPDLVVDVEEITFVPQNHTPVTGDDAVKFQKFLDMLDDCDDVQQVYHNAELEG